MNRPIPDVLIAFLRRVEGVEPKAYQDSGGVWTIGVGHTGPEVHAGLVWMDAQIDAALRNDLGTAVTQLYSVTSAAIVAGLTDDQYATLLSFVFNVGAGPAWTIWKDLKSGNLADVPVQLIKFVNAGGKKVQGLVNRRNAEIALWNGTAPECKPTKQGPAQ